MRLDLPVPWSPATTIRTPVRACGLTVLGTALTIDDAERRKPRIEKRIRVRLRCNEAKTKGKRRTLNLTVFVKCELDGAV